MPDTFTNLHEEFQAAIRNGDDRLREHIDQQIEQVKEAHRVSDQQTRLALEAAEKLELERVERLLARIANGLLTVTERSDAGDARINEHIEGLRDSVNAAIDAQLRAVTIAQEASAKAIDKALTSVDRRFDEGAEASVKGENAAQQRMDEGDDRLREHIAAQYGQINAALDSARRETELNSSASARAIEKAEVANEKRFESVNEFRSQMADQVSTFLPREVAEAQSAQLSERVRTLEALATRQSGAAEQSRRVSDRMQPWMLWAAGGVMSVFIAVIVFAANVLTAV